MSLYKVNSGDLPLASDVDQIIDVFSGKHDIGAITLAPVVSAPSNAGVTAISASGTALGVGAYIYKITYKTGYKKTNGTFNYNGETTPSGAINVTTTSANKAVNLTGLPTSWPASVVALAIYRTLVGGADGTQKLVYTMTTAVATYADTTADGVLGAAIPTVNTTGTSISGATKLSTANNVLDDGNGAASFSGNATLTQQGGSAANNFSQSVVLNARNVGGTAVTAVIRALPSGDLFLNDYGTTGVTRTKNNTLDDGTGKATFASTVIAPGFSTNAVNAGIEHGSTSVANTPFFDFHSSGNNIDYDVRIIASGGTASIGGGTLTIQAGFVNSPNGYQWNGTTMAQTRTTNGYVEWYNAGTWQGVGGVKNVQRGTAIIATSTPYYTDITITAINMSKAYVNFPNGLVMSSATHGITAQIINATTVRLMDQTNAGWPYPLSWEVVESY